MCLCRAVEEETWVSFFAALGFRRIDRIIESSVAMKDGVKSWNSLRFHRCTKQEEEGAGGSPFLLKYRLDSQMPEYL